MNSVCPTSVMVAVYCLVHFVFTAAADQSLTLKWDASPDSDISGYRLYYGEISGSSTNQLSAGNNTSATVSLLSGRSYFAYVTAVNRDGQESRPSNLLTYAPQSGPTLPLIPDQLVTEGATLAVSVTASDPDPGAVLSYTLVSGPAGASVDRGTGLFTWTPTESQGPGSSVVTVQVTDNGTPALTASTQFVVTVREVNTAPALSPAAIVNVTAGQPVQVSISATDSDLPANNLVYSLVSAPGGATLDSRTGLFNWQPASACSPGAYSVQVSVSDDGVPPLSASITFAITVVAPPSLELPVIADQTILEKTTLSISLAARNPPPGAKLSYVVLSGPAGASVNRTTGLFTWTPMEVQGPSSYGVKVQATDNSTPALTASTQFTVIVKEVNTAPVLTQIAARTVSAGQLLQVSLKASDADLPANKLTYSLVSAPAGATLDSATGAFSWRPAKTAASATIPVTVAVADNGSPPLSATMSFSVLVTGKGRQVLGQMDTVGLLSWVVEVEGSGLIRFECPVSLPDADGQPVHHLETSADLKTWSEVGPISESVLLRDTSAPGAPHRFYRVRSEWQAAAPAVD
jgi:hypothetical protein